MVLGFTLPFLMTTLGAMLVFFFNKTSKIVSMLTIGLAAGIMLSASIWSLLIPALENAQSSMGNLAFIPVVLGFLLGAVFMVLLDFVCSQFFKNTKNSRKNKKKMQKNADFLIKQENCKELQIENSDSENETKIKSKNKNDENVGLQKQKALKLFTAITIHNIPEGMSVGFAIGTAVALNSPILSAFMFALGISLQNFPEGLATALPMQNSFHHRGKAFALGTLSGLVEPIFAVVGFFLAAYITALLPWLLAFSAGAMIYVIVQEMIPEIHMENGCSWGTWAFVLGFVMMMILDICL